MALRPVGSGLDQTSDPALDHGNAGLHLPALTVAAVVLGEPLFHLSPITPRGRLGRRPANLGRDERTHAPPLQLSVVQALKSLQLDADVQGVQPEIGVFLQTPASQARCNTLPSPP